MTVAKCKNSDKQLKWARLNEITGKFIYAGFGNISFHWCVFFPHLFPLDILQKSYVCWNWSLHGPQTSGSGEDTVVEVSQIYTALLPQFMHSPSEKRNRFDEQ